MQSCQHGPETQSKVSNIFLNTGCEKTEAVLSAKEVIVFLIKCSVSA